jgi:cyclopropane-fatty-acyl-phospholipid synthase
MILDLLDRAARRMFFRAARGLEAGRVTVVAPDGTVELGAADAAPSATLDVHRPRLFRRAILNGAIGFGESYMDGDWSSPDLVTLVRLMVRNNRVLEMASGPFAALMELPARVARARRRNSRDGSQRNIGRHYDLSNDFFQLFLDANLLYSCACFEQPDDTLEIAQVRKLERICRKLRLGPDDHVLEIGTGWGGFAVYAATRYGCRVTTTTISRRQHAYAAAWFASLGASGRRITLWDRDYRDLTGRYDKLVSIEMFEAVGFRNYDVFFSAADRLLKSGGVALLQTITMPDQRFEKSRTRPDWIEKYIFPGSELASVAAIRQSLARVTDLSLAHAEDIGPHYARTLHEWRARFTANLPRVRALGFDDRFIRMWDLYLAYCEGAFAERYIGDVQLLLTKARLEARETGERREAGEKTCKV